MNIEKIILIFICSKWAGLSVSDKSSIFLGLNGRPAVPSGKKTNQQQPPISILIRINISFVPLFPFHSVNAYSFPNLKPDNPTSINGYFKSGATIFLPSHKSGHEKKEIFFLENSFGPDLAQAFKVLLLSHVESLCYMYIISFLALLLI